MYKRHPGEFMKTNKLTRFERIKHMTVEEIAQKIISLDGYFDGYYCKDDCGYDFDCPHELECCIKWLNEV